MTYEELKELTRQINKAQRDLPPASHKCPECQRFSRICTAFPGVPCLECSSAKRREIDPNERTVVAYVSGLPVVLEFEGSGNSDGGKRYTSDCGTVDCWIEWRK
jgi:hypothetical protein